MKIGEVLLGESYENFGGRRSAPPLDPSDTVATGEDLRRIERIREFVGQLPAAKTGYDDWWTREAYFIVRGQDIEAFNSSVFWLATDLGAAGVVEYPWYTVGIRDGERFELMLAAAELGENTLDSTPQIANSVIVAELKDKEKFLAYVESVLEGNTGYYKNWLNPETTYRYSRPSYRNYACASLNLTGRSYEHLQALNGISQEMWEEFNVDSCIKNLAANFDLETAES